MKCEIGKVYESMLEEDQYYVAISEDIVQCVECKKSPKTVGEFFSMDYYFPEVMYPTLSCPEIQEMWGFVYDSLVTVEEYTSQVYEGMVIQSEIDGKIGTVVKQEDDYILIQDCFGLTKVNTRYDGQFTTVTRVINCEAC